MPDLVNNTLFFTEEMFALFDLLNRLYADLYVYLYFVYFFPFSGAQDFLPDFLEAPKWYSIYGIYPKYTGLVTAMSKAKAWMMHARVSSILITIEF